ncbi:MAG: hypothetical protein ACREJ7_09295 [Candidatus Methylomirabilales bacterium]
MPGIPAKCLECGTDLRFDAAQMLYFCPACAEKKEEAPAQAEVKEAA